MSTPSATLDDILAELQAIRLVLSARPAQAIAAARAPSVQSDEAGIPQPSALVDNPGDAQVHFGKNSGTAIAKLSERSLAWYATEQPPRLDSSGKPYPPRPQDVALRNACRQLWHQSKGTLAGQATAAAHASSPAPSAETSGSDEEVPF